MRPVRLASSQFYFDVHAGRKIQLHQRVDRLRRRLHNVKHSLVSPDLKLLAGLLVDVRTAVHGKFFDPRWQRNGTDRKSVVSGKSVSVRVDLGGRRIIQKHTIIKELINHYYLRNIIHTMTS